MPNRPSDAELLARAEHVKKTRYWDLTVGAILDALAERLRAAQSGNPRESVATESSARAAATEPMALFSAAPPIPGPTVHDVEEVYGLRAQSESSETLAASRVGDASRLSGSAAQSAPPSPEDAALDMEREADEWARWAPTSGGDDPTRGPWPFLDTAAKLRGWAALLRRLAAPATKSDVSVICRECGVPISGVEAGARALFVTCQKCQSSLTAEALAKHAPGAVRYDKSVLHQWCLACACGKVIAAETNGAVLPAWAAHALEAAQGEKP